jgi:hypothetical protein
LNNHPQVLFEIYNEPKNGTRNDWHFYAQPWLDAIQTGIRDRYKLQKTQPSDNLLLMQDQSGHKSCLQDNRDKKAGLCGKLTSYSDTNENYMGYFTKNWLNS